MIILWTILSEQTAIQQWVNSGSTARTVTVTIIGHTYILVYCQGTHTKLHFPDPKMESKQLHRDDLLT